MSDRTTEPRALALFPRDWPFPAARTPFFYGWAIWALSTLGILMSVPGQTMGMAVFTDIFIVEFGLSRTDLSMAYLAGTVGSALLLTSAGIVYDRLGARTMLVGASAMLALAVLFISGIDRMGAALSEALGVPLAAVTFPLILAGYFGVRFMGQGVLTSASRNILLVWFEKRLGRVASFRGVFVSFGFSVAPLVIAALIGWFGWRGALWAMAAAVGFGFAALAALFARNRPEDCGLSADGVAVGGPEGGGQRAVVESRSLREARRSGIFWLYAFSLSIHALFGTAVTFHVVSVFAEMGRSAEEAFAHFLPQAFASVSANLLGGWLADKIALKPLLIAMLLAFLLGTVGLLILDLWTGYWMLVLGFGAGGGLWGVLSNLAFIRFFGPLNLGAISGLNQSITVAASAVGPLLFSLGFDWFGDYQGPKLACGAVICVLIVWALLMREPPRAALRA